MLTLSFARAAAEVRVFVFSCLRVLTCHFILLTPQANNEEEYIRLLKETKNERILNILRQTEEFMTKLGASIQELK